MSSNSLYDTSGGAAILRMSNNRDAKTKSDILLEFLEVAFHSILYFRDIYPKNIFCLRKKYQIPVHVSRHPEVNGYIMECLKTIKFLLEENGVKQVAVVIMTELGVPLEKYCFDLEKSEGAESDPYFVRTEEVFRQYLLKLSVADPKKLPEGCTFQVQITTTEECSVRLSDNESQAHFPWIEAEKEDDTEKEMRIIPVKTLETSLLKLNMYVER